MIRLDPAQYPLVLPLLADLDFNLVIRSVVEGNTPAWVFVDDPQQPHAVLLWDRQDALFLAGDPQDEELQEKLRDILNRSVLPNARARWIPAMEICYTPPEWQEAQPLLLPDLRGAIIRRMDFAFQGLPEDIPQRVPSRAIIRRIDSYLLQSAYSNLAYVRGWIDSFWHTPEDFLQRGSGFCAVVGDTIAAWCLTVFAAGNEREVGLETIADFRGQGFATLVATATIEEIVKNGLTPRWQCHAGNRPSVAVAEKVGFVPAREYDAYGFDTAVG
jgi:RimJ/RimL family protein N-acetyltransferase